MPDEYERLNAYMASTAEALNDAGIKMSDFQMALIKKALSESDLDSIRAQVLGYEKRVTQAEVDQAIESIMRAAQ